jgi:hypothetical protein
VALTAGELTDELRAAKQCFDTLKNTPEALAGGADDWVKCIHIEKLQRLVLDYARHVDAIDKDLDGIIYYFDHIEGTGDPVCGYVVCQADGGDNPGGFPKWVKAHKAKAPVTMTNPPQALMLFETWGEAFEYWKAIDKEIRWYQRIYPVVAVAGNEPRTTKPRQQ